MANRTLTVKGKVTKMYLDERYGTGITVAVISYDDPVAEFALNRGPKVLQRKFLVPGAGFEIGQEVTITVETKVRTQ